jgi:hypothetical protein
MKQATLVNLFVANHNRAHLLSLPEFKFRLPLKVEYVKTQVSHESAQTKHPLWSLV